MHWVTTPFEVWENRKPNVSNLRTFGSVVFVNVPKEQRWKLDTKSWIGVSIEYVSCGYRVWLLEDKKVVVERDVHFVENSNFSELVTSSRSNGNSDEFLICRVWNGPISDSDVEDDVVSQQPTVNADDPDETLAENVYEESFSICVGDGEDNVEVKSLKIYSEQRIRKTPAWHKYYNMNYTGFAFNASSYHVPTSHTEAKSSVDWEKKKAPILEEMDSLTRNHTWTL